MKEKTKWRPKEFVPRRAGWYITRTTDGFIDWRAWGAGAWWKQMKGGWIEWFDGNGVAIRYDFVPRSWHDVKLNRKDLPEIPT